MRLQKVRDAEIPLHTRLDRLHRHAYEIESTQAKLASVKGVGGAAKARPGSSAGAVPMSGEGVGVGVASMGRKGSFTAAVSLGFFRSVKP